MHSEITENPFKDELQSISIINPEAIDSKQWWEQQQVTDEAKGVIENISLPLKGKDARADCGSEDYREVSFTMIRNTSYSDCNKQYKDTTSC